MVLARGRQGALWRELRRRRRSIIWRPERHFSPTSGRPEWERLKGEQTLYAPLAQRGKHSKSSANNNLKSSNFARRAEFVLDTRSKGVPMAAEAAAAPFGLSSHAGRAGDRRSRGALFAATASAAAAAELTRRAAPLGAALLSPAPPRDRLPATGPAPTAGPDDADPNPFIGRDSPHRPRDTHADERRKWRPREARGLPQRAPIKTF